MIPEALYTDWLSKALADYFTAIGFQTRYAAVSQPVEATLPFDRIYACTNKRTPVCIFALQFKAPHVQRDLQLQYAIDGQQLQKLQQPAFRDWVFYAFPYFTNVGFQQTALHLTNFCRPLLLPPRPEAADFRLRWDSPYFYIQTAGDDKATQEAWEKYKGFDSFYASNKSSGDIVLTRRSCFIADDSICRYEIPHHSWGELFRSLLTITGGRHLRPNQIDDFVGSMVENPARIGNAVLVGLDLIRKTIDIVAILGHEGEATQSEVTLPIPF